MIESILNFYLDWQIWLNTFYVGPAIIAFSAGIKNSYDSIIYDIRGVKFATRAKENHYFYPKTTVGFLIAQLITLPMLPGINLVISGAFVLGDVWAFVSDKVDAILSYRIIKTPKFKTDKQP